MGEWLFLSLLKSWQHDNSVQSEKGTKPYKFKWNSHFKKGLSQTVNLWQADGLWKTWTDLIFWFRLISASSQHICCGFVLLLWSSIFSLCHLQDVYKHKYLHLRFGRCKYSRTLFSSISAQTKISGLEYTSVAWSWYLRRWGQLDNEWSRLTSVNLCEASSTFWMQLLIFKPHSWTS